MEVGKGRFLSTLVPNCLLVKEWLDEGWEVDLQHKVHLGVIHPEDDVRGLYVDYVPVKYKYRKLEMAKKVGLQSLNGRYYSLKVGMTPLEKRLLADLLGEEVKNKVLRGFSMLGLHVWMAKVLRAQHVWLTPLVYIPGDKYQLEKVLKKVTHYKAFRNARSTLGLELARFRFGEAKKDTKWWKAQLSQRDALTPMPMRDVL
jgi:hypothetical protein